MRRVLLPSCITVSAAATGWAQAVEETLVEKAGALCHANDMRACCDAGQGLGCNYLAPGLDARANQRFGGSR